MHKNFIYQAADGEQINITTYGNDNFQSGPCLIHVHGFKGFKNWGFNPYMAEYFASRGYFVITFNFSHNGIGENPMEFTRLDKFAENTYSREVRELKEIISSYHNGFFGEAGQNKIGIIGHSRGGGVALVAAHNNSEVSAVATWASIAKFDRYSERQKEEWKKLGYLEAVNTRTKQVMRLNYTLLEDIFENQAGSLNLEKSISELNKPLLLVHGEQDLAVPYQEAEQLYKWSKKATTELASIEATGHTFDCKHPFDGTNDKFENVLNKTKIFFDSNFK